jgi:putative adhesin
MTTIAPPSAPPPLTPGNRTALRALLVIAAAVLVVGCVAGLGVAAFGIASLRVSTDGKDLPGDMRSLVIDASDVSVHVTSDPNATAARAELRAVRSARGVPPRLDVTTDARQTRIRVTPDDSARAVDFGGPSDLKITLPPALAARLSVTTQQDDGTLTVDANLDRLIARSADGDVVLNGAVHVVDVTARDGDVVSRKPLSVTESFTVDSVDGDVAVAFADPAPRRISAATSSGDVAITLPATGPYLVRTRSGDATSVDVPETTDPARAASEVTVRSDDGSVSVDTRR